MTNDLISFGAWFYFWKIFFFVLFFLVAIVVAYPWLLIIAFGLWWFGRERKSPGAGEAAADHAGPPSNAGGHPSSTSPELPS